ncbi:MAG: DUF1080 domain-containing protein [Bacteroidales bacterium]|nr:DUF1080 domain-containing protein [Bacteroidales bacterium]
MKIKQITLLILGLFIAFSVLVDCINKKHSTNENDDQGAISGKSVEQYNVLTDTEREDGWQLLFDGETTNGWRGFNRESIGTGWTVENGFLVAPGLGGDIGGDVIYEEQFENFDLKLEWKITQGGNSGIFFHVLEGDYDAVYATGPEYQIIDDIGFPQKLEDWQTSGANYAINPPENAKIKPAGEWNSSEIIVNGPHVVHYLNGIKVVEYDLWTKEWEELVNKSKWKNFPDYGKAHKGHIGLQDHGNKIYFRNIKIKVL